MKITGMIAAAALVAAAAAGAQTSAVTVSDVRVSADLSSVTSTAAAAYWGNLEADLASAIAAQFVGITSPDGVLVAVTIDEIAMADLVQAEGGDDDQARLIGDVGLLDPVSEKIERVFTVSATANPGVTGQPEGRRTVTVSPTSEEFYAAVVRAFARGVAETVRAGE